MGYLRRIKEAIAKARAEAGEPPAVPMYTIVKTKFTRKDKEHNRERSTEARGAGEGLGGVKRPRPERDGGV